MSRIRASQSEEECVSIICSHIHICVATTPLVCACILPRCKLLLVNILALFRGRYGILQQTTCIRARGRICFDDEDGNTKDKAPK